MELKKLNTKINQILEQIQTWNDKPDPPGGNNIKHTDAGSITGNQCNFMNNGPVTDIGSITGNKCNFQAPYKQENVQTEQCECGGEAGASITTGQVFGPATSADSQANFCTAKQTQPVIHQIGSPGVTTKDIKQLYHPCLPFKKIKSKKINRKYPLFSRFK